MEGVLVYRTPPTIQFISPVEEDMHLPDLLPILVSKPLKDSFTLNHIGAEKGLGDLLHIFLGLSASCLPGGLCGTSDHFSNSLPLPHLYVLVAKQGEELEHLPF